MVNVVSTQYQVIFGNNNHTQSLNFSQLGNCIHPFCSKCFVSNRVQVSPANEEVAVEVKACFENTVKPPIHARGHP